MRTRAERQAHSVKECAPTQYQPASAHPARPVKDGLTQPTHQGASRKGAELGILRGGHRLARACEYPKWLWRRGRERKAREARGRRRQRQRQGQRQRRRWQRGRRQHKRRVTSMWPWPQVCHPIMNGLCALDCARGRCVTVMVQRLQTTFSYMYHVMYHGISGHDLSDLTRINSVTS